VDHHRQIEGRGRLLGATQSLEIVDAGDIFRQPRLDTDDDVAVARNRSSRQGHVGTVDVHQLATGEAGARRDVDERAADLRPSSNHRGDFVDVIGAARSGVDKARHAVLQSQRGRFFAATRVGVDVDQSGSNDLAPPHRLSRSHRP